MKPDTAGRYGTVSRALHWGMALLFAWLFTTAVVHFFAPRSELSNLLMATHKHVGVLLLALAVVRALWALLHLRRRPPELSRAAGLGHLALYALMLGVPLAAVLRQWGAGRPFSPLGLPLFPARDASTKVDWAVNLGNLLHGELGWALLALALGHLAMVVWHRRRGSAHDVLPRMLG